MEKTTVDKLSEGDQARSQDFSRVGAYLKNRVQIINVRTIRYASSADTQRSVQLTDC